MLCAGATTATGMAVGGATGAAVNIGTQAYNEGWDCIDWDEVGNAGIEGMYWGFVVGGGEAVLLAKMGAKAPGVIAGAASQAPTSVFQTGVNITSKSVANKYPTIGSGGRTFVTTPSAVTKIIGPLKGDRIKITSQQGRQLEGALGLKPNSLESRNIISVIQNISGRSPASPISGNSFFQGGGAGLPGGGMELTIQGIPSAGGQGIRQIILEIGK